MQEINGLGLSDGGISRFGTFMDSSETQKKPLVSSVEFQPQSPCYSLRMHE